MHKSVATIDSPEFLNLQPLDINPLMSKCEIKVFYLGANRNRSYIDRQAAEKIGFKLRGAPIVGFYKDTKEDFADHGEKIIIDDEGVHFECQTFPYGFVSPDAKVWFQDFEDEDAFGNKVTRTYLMTTGYLWTKIFTESSLPVEDEQGRPQSMELSAVEGQWQSNYADGVDYYIIEDAVISKLCILGEDVEPCFEGSSVKAPNVSKNFTLDNNFKHTLYSMMQDLKNVLEGDRQMDKEFTQAEQTETVETTEFTEETTVEETSENTTETTDSVSSDFAKKDDKKENESSDGAEGSDTEDSGESAKDSDEKTDDSDKKDAKEDEDKKKKYSLLEENYNTLKTEFDNLNTKYQELVAFKTEIDNQKKDALISEFYMLADEDKADVIQNKEKYTLEEIKAKLSVICFDKKISFSTDNNTTTEDAAVGKEEPVMTFSIETTGNSLPDWVKAVKEEMK